tara:strand:- start:621 stop:983 length:363 start_codon:yes stop_codon:yes gene_type:complete
MKAKELRIGNLVILPKGLVKPVIEVSETLVRFQNQLFEIEDVEPIPLTEEWLFKFGFQKEESDDVYCQFIDFTLDGESFLCKQEESDHMACILNGKKIDSVHQLQNLYFALTGEELEIKK